VLFPDSSGLSKSANKCYITVCGSPYPLVIIREVRTLSKKQWLVYGALITGLLLFYWQVVPDTRVLRTIVGVCVYVLSQLGIGVLRVSQSFKKSFMAILLSILLIWILDASLSTALCVFALVGIRVFAERRNSGSES
jgi:succinate dehydrogenase/fumarate reductase cytochrome b subunit